MFTNRVQAKSKLRCCFGIISTSNAFRFKPSRVHTPVAECETTRCRRIGSGLGGGVASLFPRTRAVGTVPLCSSYLFNTGAPANHRLACSLPLCSHFSSIRLSFALSRPCCLLFLFAIIFALLKKDKSKENRKASTHHGAGVSFFNSCRCPEYSLNTQPHIGSSAFWVNFSHLQRAPDVMRKPKLLRCMKGVVC